MAFLEKLTTPYRDPLAAYKTKALLNRVQKRFSNEVGRLRRQFVQARGNQLFVGVDAQLTGLVQREPPACVRGVRVG
jgi:hypothetical protein